MVSHEFESLIEELNHDFGLRLSAPGRRQPQTHLHANNNQDARTGYEVYRRLRQLHGKKQSPFLLSLSINKFKLEACQILEAWVHKPLADPDTLSHASRDAPLGAYNASERAALYKTLGGILDDVEGVQGMNDVEVVQDIESQCSTTSHGANQLRPSKRVPDEHENGPARRTRARISGGSLIDDIPMRSQQQQRQPRPLSHGSYAHDSASTSRASIPSPIFSAPPGEPEPTPISSQDTTLNDRRKFSQEYLPSTAEQEALEESFSKDPLWPPPPKDDSRQSNPLPWPDFGPRFEGIWPVLPENGLNDAPMPVLWEITRAALHCGVDLRGLQDFDFPPDLNSEPEKAWRSDQKILWERLEQHPLFLNRSLPPRSPKEAWTASLNSYQAGNDVVIFKAELVYRASDKRTKGELQGRAFQLKLLPLSTQLGHRLDRRFGSDRFIELVVPALKDYTADDQPKIIPWLLPGHTFLGRTWRPLFVKSNRKLVTERKADETTGRMRFFQTIYMFATNGNSFYTPDNPDQAPLPGLPRADVPTPFQCSVRRLLDWALNLTEPKNARQLTPKLFSRLALSLSRSYPALVLEKHQIFNMAVDVLSGSHSMVMNDGAGIISRSLAKIISDTLGLHDVPSAFQGRFGSAKGMWVIDVDGETGSGSEDAIWIKTYPSQRKWECDFDDQQHRTLEVKGWPRGAMSASLNLQFIPVLECQAKCPERMRQTMAQRLRHSLRQEMGKETAKDSRELRQLVTRNHSSMDNHPRPFLFFKGGLPPTDEDRVAIMLDAGFTVEHKPLSDLIWNLYKGRTDRLRKKMNIKVPCSAYLYIIPDFWGVLEPNEVHISFSNKFYAEETDEAPGFSDTLVEERDVLVARSPAHLPSDIQRVKAVSRHAKLRKLKDVVVFSTKGSRPLADRLSGGDYDGDQAWVCWDHDIVTNFENAGPEPPVCDFIGEGYLKKQMDSFEDLLARQDNVDSAYDEFLCNGLTFNFQPDMLGICTKYKERLCYQSKLGVADPAALVLSVLLSDLVDQAKAGITFTPGQWKGFKAQRLRTPGMYDKPEYENDKASNKWLNEVDNGRRPHVLDFLKFQVAEGTIETALTEFYRDLTSTPSQQYDSDLTGLHHEFARWAKGSNSGAVLMNDLRRALECLKEAWDEGVLKEIPFEDNVQDLHQRFMAIQPTRLDSRKINCLNDAWLRADRSQLSRPGELDWSTGTLSRWSLLKASTFFKLFYNKGLTMCWHITGRQLLHIKASVVASKANDNTVPMLVVPEMYAILKPHTRAIKRIVAAEQTAAGKGENDSLVALENVYDFDEEGTVIDDA